MHYFISILLKDSFSIQIETFSILFYVKKNPSSFFVRNNAICLLSTLFTFHVFKWMKIFQEINSIEQWFPTWGTCTPRAAWEISRGTQDFHQFGSHTKYINENVKKRILTTYLGVREFFVCFGVYASRKWLGTAPIEDIVH